MTQSTRRQAVRAVLALAIAAGSPVFSANAAPLPADRPAFLPARDVSVTYELKGSALPLVGTQRLDVIYANGGDLTRLDYYHWVEAKQPFAGLIYDRKADRVMAVQPENRSYTERAMGKFANPGAFLRGDMRFIRQGSSTIAGLTCTEWVIKTSGGDKAGGGDKTSGGDKVGGSACVTDDGVTLRLRGLDPEQATMTAIAVRFGTPAAGAFDPPRDYAKRGGR